MKKLFKHRLLLSSLVAGVGIVVYLFTLWVPSVLPPSRPLNSPSLAAVGSAPQQGEPVAATSTTVVAPAFQYLEVVDGCDWSFVGTCVNMRSGPGEEYPVVLRLRTGIVFKVRSVVVLQDGQTWYKIGFDDEIRYPERVAGDWYVAAAAVQLFTDAGDQLVSSATKTPSTKRIVVDLAQEMLYAYDGDTLFMQDPISTGLQLTPTPHGTFTVFKKTPSRYMQGPVPNVSDQFYDLPGVPWDLYFTSDGAVIHGAYWHNHFGQPWSHGCVNLAPQEAKKLYEWADVGTKVTVQD